MEVYKVENQEITKEEVDDISETQVVIDSKIYPRITNRKNYYKTFNEAHVFLITDLTIKAKRHADAQIELHNQLDEVINMEPF